MESLSQSRRDFHRETTNAGGDCGNGVHAGRTNRMEHRIHSLGGFFGGIEPSKSYFYVGFWDEFKEGGKA